MIKQIPSSSEGQQPFCRIATFPLTGEFPATIKREHQPKGWCFSFLSKTRLDKRHRLVKDQAHVLQSVSVFNKYIMFEIMKKARFDRPSFL